MAFAQRYHAEWDDLYGVHRGVEIYEKDYGGSSEAIEVYGTSPGRKRMRGIRGDEDKLINGTEFEFTFVTNNSDKSDFDHLFESNYKDHYLIFYKNYEQSNQQIKFRGWLKPENMKRVFIDAVYHITVSATDALADLKDIDFLQSDNSFYEGELSVLEAIKEALDKINTDSDSPFALDFRIVSNIHETSLMSTDSSGNPTDNALRVTNIDTRRFLKDDGGRVKAVSCNAVIERVLFLFNAKIKQKDDQYWIVDNDESAYAGDNQITHYVHEIAWNDLTTTTRSEITNYKNITDDVQFQRGGDFSKLKPLKGLDVIFKNKYQGADITTNVSTGDPVISDWADWTVSGAVSSNVATDGTLEVECNSDDYSCMITSPEFEITEETDEEYIKIIFDYILNQFTATAGGTVHFFIEVHKPFQNDGDWFKMDETIHFGTDWFQFISPNSSTFKVDHSINPGTYQMRIKLAVTTSAELHFKPPTLKKIVPTGSVSGDSADVLSFVTSDISYIGRQAGGLGIPETDTWFGDSTNEFDIGRLSIGGTLTELWSRFNRSDASPIIDLKIQSRLNNRKKYASIVKFTYVDTEDVIDTVKVLKVGSNTFGVEEGWYEVIGLDKEYFKGVVKVTARQLFTQDVTLSFTSSQLRSADGTSTTSPYSETGGGGDGTGGSSDNPVFQNYEIFHNDNFNFNTVNDQTFNFNSINQDRNLFNFYENNFGDTENFLGGVNYDYSSDSLLLNQIDLNLDQNDITNINSIGGGGTEITVQDILDLNQNNIENVTKIGGSYNDNQEFFLDPVNGGGYIGGWDGAAQVKPISWDDQGFINLQNGTNVNDIGTDFTNVSDNQLLTSQAIQTYVDNEVGSWSLEDARSVDNVVLGAIDMNGNNLQNVNAITGSSSIVSLAGLQFRSSLSNEYWITPGNGNQIRIGGPASGDIHSVYWNRLAATAESPNGYAFEVALGSGEQFAVSGGSAVIDGNTFQQAVGSKLVFNTDTSERSLITVTEDALGSSGTSDLGNINWDYANDRFKLTKGVDMGGPITFDQAGRVCDWNGGEITNFTILSASGNDNQLSIGSTSGDGVGMYIDPEDGTGIIKSTTWNQPSGNFTVHKNLDVEGRSILLDTVVDVDSSLTQAFLVERADDGSNRALINYSFTEFEADDFSLNNLPTTDPGSAGQLWNDSGTVKVST